MTTIFQGCHDRHGKERLSKVSVLFIFLIYLYFLVPTEAVHEGVNAALVVRSLVCGFFVMLLFCLNGLFTSGKLLACFLLFSCLYLISALNSFGLKMMLAFESLCLGMFWAYSFSREKKINKYLIRSLEVLIYVSFASLVLQLLLHRFWGYVDIHAFIYPWSEARYGDQGSFVRLGGLYIEPGTLANWVYAFFLVVTISQGYINTKLGLVTATAMAVSLSAWGMAISILVFACIAMQRGALSVRYGKVFLRWRLLIFSIFIVTLIPLALMSLLTDDMIAFLEMRFTFQSGSGDVRLTVYEEYMSTLQEILFLGLGYNSEFCANCKSAQDAGLFFGFSVVYGLFFSILFFSLIAYSFYKRLGLAGFFLVLPLLNTKIYYWDFVVYLIFFSAFYQIYLVPKNAYSDTHTDLGR